MCTGFVADDDRDFDENRFRAKFNRSLLSSMMDRRVRGDDPGREIRVSYYAWSGTFAATAPLGYSKWREKEE
jgi:hypothetical protein